MAAITPALISGGINLGSSLLASILGRKRSEETPIQAKQGQLIDQLLSSLNGEGPYSSLFNVDENAFQKSFVDPMKQKFQSQIAPQIQQSYISSGQQRGTGLDDTLTRAGVNMDQLLNQYYYQAQQAAQNRQANTMGSILGMGAGAAPEQSIGESAMQGLGGYSSGGFGSDIGDILNRYRTYGQDQKRKGFENTGGQS